MSQVGANGLGGDLADEGLKDKVQRYVLVVESDCEHGVPGTSTWGILSPRSGESAGEPWLEWASRPFP